MVRMTPGDLHTSYLHGFSSFPRSPFQRTGLNLHWDGSLKGTGTLVLRLGEFYNKLTL